MATRTKSKSHPHAALPEAGAGSLISDARLLELYAAMLRCRMLRDRIRRLAARSKLRTCASCSEAVAAATVIGLWAQDAVISSAPHLCAALLKGVPLESILRPFCARGSAANHRGNAGQADSGAGILVAPFAGSGLGSPAAGTLAAGAAFAGMRGSRENVAVVFFEHKGRETGWRQVFEFALAQNLPLIFVRQAGSALPPGRRGKSKSLPGTLPIIPVDSNDAVAVYRVAHEAIAHARRGSGPTLIDCLPLRLAGEHRQDSDCIARMERYLAAKGLRPERIQTRVSASFTRALDAAVATARRSPRANRRVRRSGKSGA